MKNYILSLFAVLCSLQGMAQLQGLPTTLQIVWQKTLGNNNNEYATSLQKTCGGNYLIHAGRNVANPTFSCTYTGGYNSYVFKTDSVGNQLALYCGDSSTQMVSMAATNDCGFVLLDHKLMSSATQIDIKVTKFDSAGGVEWYRYMGGSLVDRADHIRKTKDGNLLVKGRAESDNGDLTGAYPNNGATAHNGLWWDWLLKLDVNTGATIFSKMPLLWGSGVAYNLIELPNGNIISPAGAPANNAVFSDFRLGVIDSAGNQVFEKRYGGTREDLSYSACLATNGDVLLSGYTYSNDTLIHNHNANTSTPYVRDGLIMRISPTTGNVVWAHTYGSLGNNYEYVGNILPDPNHPNNFYVCGVRKRTETPTADYDAWIFKINGTNGDVLWEELIGGSKDDALGLYSADSLGNILLMGGTSSNDGMVSGLNNGGNFGTSDIWMVMLHDPTSLSERSVPPPAPAVSWRISPLAGSRYQVRFVGEELRYPVPLVLTDATGKQLQQLSATSNQITIDLSAYNQGIYFLRSAFGAAKLVR